MLPASMTKTRTNTEFWHATVCLHQHQDFPGVQVQHGHWQQALQQQSSQDRSSVARHRRLADAVEKEHFMQWNSNACCSCSGHASFPITDGDDAVSAEDNALNNACNVLNIKNGSPLADIRCRLTDHSFDMCRLVLLCVSCFERIVALQCNHWEAWAISLICVTALSVLVLAPLCLGSFHLI